MSEIPLFYLTKLVLNAQLLKLNELAWAPGVGAALVASWHAVAWRCEPALKDRQLCAVGCLIQLPVVAWRSEAWRSEALRRSEAWRSAKASVGDCMSRAATGDMSSCDRCRDLITSIHDTVALAVACKDAPVNAQQPWTVPRNTREYLATPKRHIWVPSSPSGEHARVHCAPLTLVSMLVCIAPP
jgi:hypothetical protein